MIIDYNNLTDEQLAVFKVKCEDSLEYFTRFFFRVLRGSKFILNWHHTKICKELENTASYKYQLLNINIPPRHSKTELAGINFIAHSLAKNPRGNYLYITASDELRSETSVRIRDIITHPYYIKMFGVYLKKDQKGKNLWRTTAGGGLKTATIFGQITGFGAGRMVDYSGLVDYIEEFEGAIILDDINKISDTQSDNKNNEKAVDTIFNTILSRKNSEKTPIINIQQKAGENDASAALLEHYSDVDHKSLVMPILINGEPLWKFKHSMADIIKLRDSPRTSETFDTQFMQEVNPKKGRTFPRDKLNYFNITELGGNPINTLGWIDTSGSGTDNFSMPIAKIYRDGMNFKIYITDVMYNKEDMEVNEPRCAQLVNDNRMSIVGYEMNQFGRYGADNLQKLVTAEVKAVFETSNKHYRIIEQAPQIRMYVHFRNDDQISHEYKMFMSDMCKYLQSGKSKGKVDSPDSMAGLMSLIRSIYEF